MLAHPLDTTCPQTRANRRARFAMRGLRTVAVCLLIAVAFATLNDAPFWHNLTHSLCIGMLCWLSIDLGRMLLARWKHRHLPNREGEAISQWPGWPLMLVAVVLGTLFGFSAGHALANWITGVHSFGYFRGDWRQIGGLLLGSLVPGLAITYWFYSRETIAAQEAAVQVAQRQAAEHQLKLLESQLEPHMLFNTLANLRVLIGMDPPRAQAMLDQLIAFLRATLNGSRVAQHPLADEFARLADYLALMQVRMGARLSSRFELPPALAGAAVPPLLLQPLVENCIKHGLEPHVGGGRIDLSAAREAVAGGADQLVLRVRDTGAGLASPASADGTRFGLTQVRERLATLYGERASLTLADAPDDEGGTLATVRLPLVLAAAAAGPEVAPLAVVPSAAPSTRSADFRPRADPSSP